MGEVPRVVLGLYDGAFGDYRFSHVHQMIEMPLNHLGLVVRPHDIRRPLPAIERMGDVRGIVTAFISDAIFADPAAYLAWLDGALKAGKRVAIMNFTGVGRSRAGVLSGGERRLLEIARALVMEPAVLLIDEPSIGLEPRYIDLVFEVLADLRAKDGKTIVMVEQNAKKGLEFADIGYVLVAGRLALAGRGSDLLADPRVGRLFLGG